MKKNVIYSEIIKNLDNTTFKYPVIEFNNSINCERAKELVGIIMDYSLENFRTVADLANIVLDKKLDLPCTITCNDSEHLEEVFEHNTLDEIIEKKLLSDKEIIIELYSRIISGLYSTCKAAEEVCEILDYKLNTNFEYVINELHFVLSNILNNISTNRISGNEPIYFTGIDSEYFKAKIEAIET